MIKLQLGKYYDTKNLIFFFLNRACSHYAKLNVSIRHIYL